MSNILGMWISLGKRQTANPDPHPAEWPIDIACPIPQKRTKTIFESRQDEETAVSELLSAKSTRDSTTSSELMAKIEQLRALFHRLCTDDQLDLAIYSSLDQNQKEVVDSILSKRYKESLIKELTNLSRLKQGAIDTYLHMKAKRMDHVEKSILSMQLNILREGFKSVHYGTARPKDLHDAVNKKLFKYYFDGWMDSEKPISISSIPSSKSKISNPPEILPRHAALFCIKKGLTNFWFKTVSTKFLEAVMNVSLEKVKSYCVKRFSVKLLEIFPESFCDSEVYFKTLAQRVKTPKFKLPLTLKEIVFSYQKTKKKMMKLRVITEENELEEFKTEFGAETYREHLVKWRGGVLNTLGSSQ